MKDAATLSGWRSSTSNFNPPSDARMAMVSSACLNDRSSARAGPTTKAWRRLPARQHRRGMCGEHCRGCMEMGRACGLHRRKEIHAGVDSIVQKTCGQYRLEARRSLRQSECAERVRVAPPGTRILQPLRVCVVPSHTFTTSCPNNFFGGLGQNYLFFFFGCLGQNYFFLVALAKTVFFFWWSRPRNFFLGVLATFSLFFCGGLGQTMLFLWCRGHFFGGSWPKIFWGLGKNVSFLGSCCSGSEVPAMIVWRTADKRAMPV